MILKLIRSRKKNSDELRYKIVFLHLRSIRNSLLGCIYREEKTTKIERKTDEFFCRFWLIYIRAIISSHKGAKEKKEEKGKKKEKRKWVDFWAAFWLIYIRAIRNSH